LLNIAGISRDDDHLTDFLANGIGSQRTTIVHFRQETDYNNQFRVFGMWPTIREVEIHAAEKPACGSKLA